MSKRIYPLILILAMALIGAVVVFAQETTVEPPVDATLPLPTIEVTVGVTTSANTTTPVATTAAATTAATLVPTMAATTDGTAMATSQPSSQPNMEMNADATNEVPVTPEVSMTPVANGALMRVAYFANDDQNVDVYVDNVLLFQDMHFPSVSSLIAVEPGTHNVTVVWAGDAVSDSVLNVDVSVSAGTVQTVAVIGSSDNVSLNTALITEDYSDLLPGTGGFTFFNAVQDSPAVTVDRDDVVYFAGIEYPTSSTSSASSSLRVDSGTFDIRVTAADDPSNVLAERTNLNLPENAYTLVALVGSSDNPRLFTVVTDAADVAIARGNLPEPGRILDALNANENLTGFAGALDNGGLSDMLSGTDEYTVFAPANFVVDNDVNAQSALALRSYIVEGKYTSQELIDAGTLTAVDGTTLTITTDNNGIYVNGVQLIDVNIPATNGVIHMLSGTWDMGMAGMATQEMTTQEAAG